MAGGRSLYHSPRAATIDPSCIHCAIISCDARIALGNSLSSSLLVSLKIADIPVFPQLHRLLTGRYTASSRLHLTALPGCVLDSCPDVIAHELQTPKCGHSATTTTTRPLHAVLGMRSAHRTSPNSCTSPVSTSNRPLPVTMLRPVISGCPTSPPQSVHFVVILSPSCLGE